MKDGRVWQKEDLAIETEESYCYDDDKRRCKTGRLYTWKSAQRGCRLLGDEWELPSNEEWEALAKAYGGVSDNSNDNGQSAYVNLREGGTSSFNARLGGNREPNGDYKRIDAHGFYWTATEHDSVEAVFYNFAGGTQTLNRHSGDKDRAAAVRCIKSTSHK